MINTIILGDCLEKIYDLDENSVDLILTDPPYNIADDGKLTKVGDKIQSTNQAWGDGFNDSRTEEDYSVFIDELSKAFDYVLSDEGSILLYFDRSKPYHLKPLYERFVFRNMLIFVKKNPIPHFRKNNYRSTYEQCAWFSREKYNINFISQSKMKNVFYGNIGDRQTEHPTEKYEWMIQPLIERHSREGDVVLDPMCGSGTTCVVAKKMNRKYLGIEFEEQWYELAKKRVQGTSNSLTQFF